MLQEIPSLLCLQLGALNWTSSLTHATHTDKSKIYLWFLFWCAFYSSLLFSLIKFSFLPVSCIHTCTLSVASCKAACVGWEVGCWVNSSGAVWLTKSLYSNSQHTCTQTYIGTTPPEELPHDYTCACIQMAQIPI